jgi:hypothetical protein
MPHTESKQGPDFENAPVFPTTVTLAGIAWVIFGGLILLNLLGFLLVMFGLAAGARAGERAAAVAGVVCGGLIIGLFGVVFIIVGVQSVRGTARDTLGNGIGSMIFGLLNVGTGAMQGEAGHVIQGCVGFLVGAGLIAAGVLALVGRGDYKAWRQDQKARFGAGPRVERHR